MIYLRVTRSTNKQRKQRNDVNRICTVRFLWVSCHGARIRYNVISSLLSLTWSKRPTGFIAVLFSTISKKFLSLGARGGRGWLTKTKVAGKNRTFLYAAGSRTDVRAKKFQNVIKTSIVSSSLSSWKVKNKNTRLTFVRKSNSLATAYCQRVFYFYSTCTNPNGLRVNNS